MGGAALAGRDAADISRTISNALFGMEGALRPGKALGHHAGIGINKNSHGSGPLHSSDDFLRCISKIIGGDNGKPAISEDLLAQINIGAFKPHHQRHF